jgi:uncharacterized secreted protein with C-terminal beta-propeller domain
MSRTTIIVIASAMVLVIVAAILVCGCTGTTTMTSAGDLKKFNSTDEIKQYIKANTQLVQESYYGYGVTDGAVRSAEAVVSAPPVAFQGAAKSSADFSTISAAADYSQTNVQVAGVDEPDFVKNDGRTSTSFQATAS